MQKLKVRHIIISSVYLRNFVGVEHNLHNQP